MRDRIFDPLFRISYSDEGQTHSTFCTNDHLCNLTAANLESKGKVSINNNGEKESSFDGQSP